MTTTDIFEQAFAQILSDEGPYENDPADPGGATCWGVTCSDINPTTGIEYTPEEIKELTQEQARVVYLEQYWRPLGCPEQPPTVARAVFNFGVTSSIAAAMRLLQKTLGSDLDGLWGTKTASDLRGYIEIHGAPALTQAYLEGCTEKYREYAHNGCEGFLEGWLDRTYRLAKALGVEVVS